MIVISTKIRTLLADFISTLQTLIQPVIPFLALKYIKENLYVVLCENNLARYKIEQLSKHTWMQHNN